MKISSASSHPDTFPHRVPTHCSWCRNRERQQRFRQRQKAKIETLESQVVKLTAQAKALNAEKEDLGGRALKYQDLLQGRDRALAGMTAQIAQLRCSGPPSRPLIPESQQLTLTYCNPSLVLNGAQVSAFSVFIQAKSRIY